MELLAEPVLFNHWHVVGRSQDLKAGKVLSVRLLEQDLVLWRDDTQALAWQNRCPHRGARLSLGKVVNNTLVCPYHGLAYNSRGYCVKIPAQPTGSPPAQVNVQTYQTQERYGLVWVCLGKPDRDIPNFSEWDDPSYRRICCGPYHYRSSAFRALENFLDIAHFPFVHGGLLGDPEHPEIADYQVEASRDGITVRNLRVWQSDPDGTGQAAPVTYEYQVLRPLTAYFCKQSNGRRFAIFFNLTPVNQEECIGWMWIAMNYAREVPEAELRAFQDKLVAQDIAIVESQRPQCLPLDLQAEVHLLSDRASIAYRKWLKQLGVTFGVTP